MFNLLLTFPFASSWKNRTSISSLVTFSQNSKTSLPPATDALQSVNLQIVRSFLASEIEKNVIINQNTRTQYF